MSTGGDTGARVLPSICTRENPTMEGNIPPEFMCHVMWSHPWSLASSVKDMHGNKGTIHLKKVLVTAF